AGEQAGLECEGLHGSCRREAPARAHRRGRCGLEGHRRRGQDARCGSTELTARRRGPWRVAVTEASMAPAIEPGDWLVVNPLASTWPRAGAVVVFHEPISDALAIKRVAAGPGERVRFADGYLTLGPDEAWLIADAAASATAAAGYGPPIDSTR